MSKISLEVLEKLRLYDSPTISNIIELFDARPRTAGFMDGRIQASFPELPPMVGFASTVTCRTALEPQGADAYTSLPDQVARFAELDGPPVVVFQDLDDPPVAATFGEIMCTTYQRFGAVGLITNGGGRDFEQVHALNFPVFTDGALVSHGYIKMHEVHAPVRVGGLAVYPGDLLHGDLNGVVKIPLNIASEVADIAAEFVAAERVILDTLANPTITVAELRAATGEADTIVEALRQQVTGKR
ncbi:RraA family protein [Chloroflexota bacterium]